MSASRRLVVSAWVVLLTGRLALAQATDGAVAPPPISSAPAPHQTLRSSAAFVGLGIAGVGALGVGTITYLGRTSTSPWVGLVAVPLSALLDFGLARLLDLPVTPLSASEGALFGTATAGLGYLLGTLSAQALSMDARNETSLGVIGLVVGGALGVPIWTLIDPLAFGGQTSPTAAGAPGDQPAFHAVADERHSH
jgi:hypothetical protein